MSEKSEQINIRSSTSVARELRAESQRRGLPLGETLEQLLALARAKREPGAWLDLDVEGDRALRAVAASRGESPAELLARMVRGRLRDELMILAEALESEAIESLPSSGAALLRHTPTRDLSQSDADCDSSSPGIAKGQSAELEGGEQQLEEELDRVGIFSVFE
ncbi:MAG: hypothetical protein CMP23_03215 [Rickettsiales bacterium]|nr:hypothetical protein [Rickettsiales bacterium]|tara:strand:+ start:5853 stop:6344 length:492 start_codon:yes stop_codon:yes gene_type:complete